MANQKAKILLIFSFTLIILFILSQTILLTWSPIKIGYNLFKYKKYNVYTEKPPIDEVFVNLDSIFLQCEDEHNLRLKRKVEIIICDAKKIRLYIPWLNTSTAAGVWPKTIYISTGSIETFKNPILGIKHELSHILLLQNYGEPSCAYIWKNHEWLLEGYVVYVTQGYPKFRSRNEVFELLKENVSDYELISKNIFSKEVLKGIPMTVRYSLYYYYVKYLIEKKGKDKFLLFINLAFSKLKSLPTNFSKTFGTTIDNSLLEFRRYLSE
jgi:hypothetical protein